MFSVRMEKDAFLWVGIVVKISASLKKKMRKKFILMNLAVIHEVFIPNFL